MSPDYPYQLVCFLDKEPEIGETVYSGKNGWYPQLALKRRFKFLNMSEDDGLRRIEEFCRSATSLSFISGELTHDDRMPVKYIEIPHGAELISFHQNFVSFMGTGIESRFPERDGANYLPHITAEYNGEMVIKVDDYTSRPFSIKRVCLLKDVEGENSAVYKYYPIAEA
jgi:hypothetical protein